LHESERILKWGWFWFGERRGFYGKPGLVAKVELGLWVGTWPLSHLSTLILIIMPKIKTTRTKKAPEGFEEIEPVGMIYCFQCNPL